MSNLKAEANEVFDKHYAGLDLSDKHAAAIRDVIYGALKEGKKPTVRVERWAEKKGVALGKLKTPDQKSAPAQKEGGTDSSKLDRKSLKATMHVLREAGVKVKYNKEESTEQLASNLSAALNGLPSPEMMEKLERIDPVKLKVLHGDGACLGLFVDLSQPECQVCEDRDECIQKYIKNLDGNLKMFRDAMVDQKTEAAAKSITKEEAEAVAKSLKKNEKEGNKRLKFDKSLEIYVMDVENPVSKKKEPDAYEMVKDILNKVPSTLGELRKITHTHFQYDEDRDFMEELFTQLRDYGVIKLWDELSKDQKKAYKKDAASTSSDDDDDDNEDEEEEDEDDEDED